MEEILDLTPYQAAYLIKELSDMNKQGGAPAKSRKRPGQMMSREELYALVEELDGQDIPDEELAWQFRK